MSRIRSLVAGSVALALGVVPVAMAHDGVFTDTPPTMEHYQHIKHAKETGLTNGWADGTFRPTVPATREAVAAFMYRFLNHPDFEGHGYCFTDVKPETTEFMKEICWLKDTGLSTGWADGTFRPKEPITREAFMAFLSRVSENRMLKKGGNMPTTSQAVEVLKSLKDVSLNSHMFSRHMAWGKMNHISEGWADGTFRPAEPIQRIAVIAMLDRIAHMPWGDEYRDMNPKSPVKPDPVEPADPDPVKPADPTVEQPADPDPVKPADPDPVKPADPTVEEPSDPDPVKPADPTVEQPADPTVSHELDMSRSKPAQKQLFPLYRSDYGGKELDRAGVIKALKTVQSASWYYDTDGNKLSYTTRFSEGNNTNAGWLDVVVTFKDGFEKVYPKVFFVQWRD